MTKSRQKDRAYLTTTEWKHEWGGYKGDKGRVPFKRLPFHCCAITFTPFEDPVATDDGTVYDVTNIVPYVMKYKRHPVSGQPLALKDLIKLNFHKNGEGQYDCPVTGKVFTEHTHIAAVKTTGNVYAYEALEELCIKPKSWKDLLTDEPFTRKDIIHIQDPLNLSGKSVQEFDHVKQGLVLDEPEDANDGASVLRNVSEDMKRALGALQTSEAKAAFEGGGGGKRMEALRLLAAAKNAAGGKKGAAVKTEGGTTIKTESGVTIKTEGDADRAASGAAASTSAGGGDWRLRAPERTVEYHQREGAHTWDTEDYTTKAGQALRKKEERMAEMRLTAGIKNEATKEAVLKAARAQKGSGQTPQERYEAAGHVKYIEAFSSTGQASQSFTSTYANVHTKANRQLVRLERNPTKKGYARIHTNLGDINIELHCDITPRTCENFLGLAAMGYYDNTVFHRSIKNFMIQGGDPTGTGQGGESIYGKTFKDEFDSRLTHTGRGVLSMANSGKATNGSQFFITYKSCTHLNNKHSVFGKVVGGLEVLTAMERIETDEDDRPLEEIKITGVTIFVNPYQEMEDAEKAEAEAASKAEALKLATITRTGEGQIGKWYSAPGGAPAGATKPSSVSAALDNDAPNSGASGGGGVGRYLSAALEARTKAPAAAAAAGVSGDANGRSADDAAAAAAMPPPPKKAKLATQMTNFDAW